ncbi:MAG TPA: cytochrome c oxidase assembly protein [Puia sp.]
MRIYFLVGALSVLAVCLFSPLLFPGGDYPYSTHMLRHMLLLLVAGPLFVLSIPAETRFKKVFLGFSSAAYRRPFLTWITGVGLMWVWHIPFFYNSMSMPAIGHKASLAMNVPADLHSLSLLAGGMIFCWPIIAPYREFRLPALKAVLYLSSSCVFCSLLGLVLTFAPAGTFMKVSPADQQAGGLIMWVPCCFIYLSASMYLLIKWFSLKEEMPLVHSLNH